MPRDIIATLNELKYGEKLVFAVCHYAAKLPECRRFAIARVCNLGLLLLRIAFFCLKDVFWSYLKGR